MIIISIIIDIIYTLSFSQQCELMGFHRSLSENRSPQVSRTFLSILVNLNYAVVWIVSTRPVTSKSSSPSINSLMTVPRAPIIIGIIVAFMYHSFFSSLVRSKYLSFFTLSILLWGQQGQQNPEFGKFSSGLLTEMR